MAKKKDQDVDISTTEELGANSEVYSPFFEAELETASKVMGRHNILVDDEAKSRKYGLELPSLALQHLFQTNVIPMEHLIMVGGKPQSHKSSFCFDVGRWAVMQGGYARVYETEGKWSPSMVQGLYGNTYNSNTFRVIECDTLDKWVETFKRMVLDYKKHFGIGRALKKGEKPKKLLPGVVIIDSITGRTTEEEVKASEKEGASRNVQGLKTAKAIHDWLQVQSMRFVPWVTLLVRHMKKDSIGATFAGGNSDRPTGGAAPTYSGSTDIRMAVINAQNRYTEWGYNVIRFRTAKNSFGPDKMQCDARFSWRYVDDADGNRVQIPKWEWDLATAEFLAAPEAVKVSAAIKDIAHVVQAGTVAKPTFNCKQLGLSNVSGDELGTAIRLDEKIYRELQNFLHIQQWEKFDPDMEVPRS